MIYNNDTLSSRYQLSIIISLLQVLFFKLYVDYGNMSSNSSVPFHMEYVFGSSNNQASQNATPI